MGAVRAGTINLGVVPDDDEEEEEEEGVDDGIPADAVVGDRKGIVGMD